MPAGPPPAMTQVVAISFILGASLEPFVMPRRIGEHGYNHNGAGADEYLDKSVAAGQFRSLHTEHAGQKHRGRPDDRGRNIGGPELQAWQARDSRHKRHDRAHGAEEPADEHAGRTESQEEFAPAFDEFGIAAERPCVRDDAAIAPPEPPRDRIAHDRAQDRARDEGRERDRPVRHEEARGDHDCRAGEQEAHENEGFAERGDEDDRKHPFRMRANKRDDALDEIRHERPRNWIAAKRRPAFRPARIRAVLWDEHYQKASKPVDWREAAGGL